MTELLTKLIPYQTDHLFVLVGANPLPCYIAGKLLATQGGTIYLLYSIKTEDYANWLTVALGGSTPVPLGNTERNPDNIYAQICEYAAKLKGAIGLHYTGGTKVMAVHSYRAILKTHPHAMCSYLDSDRLEICFEQHSQAYGSPIKLRARETNVAVGLTLHQLWQLHGKQPLPMEHAEFSERSAPIIPGMASLLANHLGDSAWQAWIAAFKGKDKLQDHESIDTLPYQDVVELLRSWNPAMTTIGQLHAALNSRSHNYLGDGGDWLEDWVLQQLQELKSELAINDVVCSARTQRPHKRSECEMELDVVAIRGYQLFVFSCYVGSHMNSCKAKLYEAAMRAQQLGGSEARFALVCGHTNKQQVADQMSGTLSTRSFAVFDRHDLPNLKAEMRQWIRNVDKETGQ
jgi:hypothetical protein